MDIVKSKWARFFFFPLLLLFFLELTLSYFIFLDIAENSRQLLEIESKIKLCQSAPPDLSNSVNYVLKGLEEKNAYAPAEGSSVKKASQTVFPENISELFLQNNTFSKASATIDRKKFRVLFPEGWHFLIVCRLKLAADLGCLQNEQLLAALEKIGMGSEYYNSNFSFGGSESFVFIADEKTYDLIENFHDDEVFTNLYEKLGATHHEQVIMADENKAPKHIRIGVKMMANKADPSLSEFFERYGKGQRESIWRGEKASQKSWDDSSWSRGA